MKRLLMTPLLRFAGKLRFPTLFVLTLSLFVLNVLIPDPLPFIDEMLLALASLLFAAWRRKPEQAKPDQANHVD